MARVFKTPVVLPAGGTSAPSLRLPHGAAPSAPTDGDVWTTTSGLFVRVNAATKTVADLETAQTFTGTKTFATSGIKVGQTTLAQGVNGTITFPASAGTLALNNQTFYIGTTSVAINRSSAALTLAGITLTDGVLNNIVASAASTAADLWSEITTGSITLGAGLTTGGLALATAGTGATPITIGHTNATIGITGNTTITGTIAATELAGSLLSSANPIINGTAAPGTATIPSRQDHVHPTDTSRATDSLVVHLAGTETITGAKTFTTKPVMSVSSGGAAQFQSSIVGYNWIELRSSATGAFNGANAILFTNYGDTGRQFQMTSLVGGGLIFETGDGSSTTMTERMRIDSAGSVLADDIRSLALVMGAF